MSKEIEPLQRARFNKAFTLMMAKASPDLKKKWNGEVNWKEDNSGPDFKPEFVNELTPAMRARYIDMLNKMSRNSL